MNKGNCDISFKLLGLIRFDRSNFNRKNRSIKQSAPILGELLVFYTLEIFTFLLFFDTDKKSELFI